MPLRMGRYFMSAKYFGAIMINVSGIQLSIVDLKTLKSLENVKKSINLGDYIYHDQPVTYETMLDISKAVGGFVQVLNDYGVSDYQFYGSHAVSQAVNVDFIADQLFIHTGLRIQWLSISEETFYRNQEILVRAKRKKISLEGSVYMIAITSGVTTLTKFQDGEFQFSSSFALGPIRIAEDLESLRQSSPNSIGILNDYIDSKLSDFIEDQPKANEKSRVVLMGTVPLKVLVDKYINRESNGMLSADEFNHLEDNVLDFSNQYLIEKYHIEESYVPLVLPELLLIKRLLELVNAGKIRLLDEGIINGVVIDHSVKEGFLKQNFDNQIVTTALNMAEHYQVNNEHQALVTKFALHLFDQMKSLHQLGNRDRLELEVASILHDVGDYIDVHNHYLHSDYIIKHSDILGFSNNEREIVAAITRYHSSTTPSDDLSHFRKESLENRRTIAKLASILRMADALDDDRQQKIERISVSVKKKTVVITAFSNSNLAFENWVFNSKSRFFEETYGLKPVLKQRRFTKNG